MILPGTYQNGFAPRDGQPLYPELWRGCVGAWNPGLGPSGLTLRDWSGRGNHGTLTNMDAGTDWVVSQGRYALDFDGINDSVNSQLSLDNSVGFSISLWHRFDAYTSSFPVPLKLAVSGSGGFPFFLFWATAGTYNGLNLGSGGFFPQLRSNTSVNAGSWQHIGIVCNGNGTNAAHYTLYLDGVVVPLVMAGAYAPVDNVTQIGTTGGANTFFDGLIDDIRVYNCALSSNQTRLLALSRGIAYELAPRRRASSAVQFNRRRRLLLGST